MGALRPPRKRQSKLSTAAQQQFVLYFCAGKQRFICILGRFYIKINRKYQKVEVPKMSIVMIQKWFGSVCSRAGPNYLNEIQKLRKEYLT